MQMVIYRTALAWQCPCTGGKSNPLLLLLLVVGTWVFISWARRAFAQKGGQTMNNVVKIAIVVILAVAVVAVIALKRGNPTEQTAAPGSGQQPAPTEYMPAQLTGEDLPALIDVGAGTCIPCKLMAPILEELKEELQGKAVVRFVDLNKFPDAARAYGIRVMPTQIFYDASGKELFRHEGFYSKEDILARFKELGVALTGPEPPAFERLTPAKLDDRPKDSICYMCERDINPRTRVTVQTDKGPVRLCSPHCYFIMYSCLTEDKTAFEDKVSMTDWSTDNPVPATKAVFLYGQDEASGKPWIKAFADRQAAVSERTATGGNILPLAALQEEELSHRCGFCDRAVYPQDAAEVIVEGGLRTWGCCSHCALGVAARTGKNIEVHERDRLTREPIVVKAFDGGIASLEPKTAVAWFGQRKKPDGTWGSAGCFHQGFFVNADNLEKWVEQNPVETGRLIPIAQALADKMKLSPEQISKACKIGECAPKN